MMLYYLISVLLVYSAGFLSLTSLSLSFSISFGNNCKFSHVMEGNIGFKPQEGGGGRGFGRRSYPPTTGGFGNRSSGFGGSRQHQQHEQQSTYDSKQLPSVFRSSQPFQNSKQDGGGGAGGFGIGFDQKWPSPGFGNQTGFGLSSSQRTQLNTTTPSSHGGGGFQHSRGHSSNYGTKGGGGSYGNALSARPRSPRKPEPCRYWAEGK